MNAVRIGPRAAAATLVASLVGVMAFCWPLLVTAESTIAHGRDAPWIFALLLTVVLAVVLAELSERGMDAKAVAMLSVLSAVGAVLRPLGGGTAGVETVFFLLVLGERVFGPGFGFVLGNTTLFASACSPPASDRGCRSRCWAAGGSGWVRACSRAVPPAGSNC
jgi:energy-coupling factor transport system substrate-specific component